MSIAAYTHVFITHLHSPAVSISSVTVTTIPNDTLYVDTFSDFMCNTTLSEYVDTPTTIMYQWLGPSLLTTGADYNITGDTLRINRFNPSRDNGRTITLHGYSGYHHQDNSMYYRAMLVRVYS